MLYQEVLQNKLFALEYKINKRIELLERESQEKREILTIYREIMTIPLPMQKISSLKSKMRLNIVEDKSKEVNKFEKNLDDKINMVMNKANLAFDTKDSKYKKKVENSKEENDQSKKEELEDKIVITPKLKDNDISIFKDDMFYNIVLKENDLELRIKQLYNSKKTLRLALKEYQI
jgi:hypothetical protein